MTRAIKLLVLDTGKEWGGGTNSLLELLKRIDRECFSVTACFYHNYPKGKDSCLSQELAALGIPLVLLQPEPQPFWAKLAKELVRGLLFWQRRWRNEMVFFIEQHWRILPRADRLIKVLQNGGYSLLYVNNQPSSNLEAYVAAQKLDIPLVQHCRIEASLNTAEVDWVNRVAHSVICVSHGVAESLAAQGVYADKLRVVRNAIDGSQPLPIPHYPVGVPPRAVLLGAVGSLIKRKAVDHLLRAVARLANDQVHVLVVGDGPEARDLHLLVAELGLAEKVHFVGFQQYPLPWMATMDVVVLSSFREGLPRVLLEAMLLSKPVVASAVVGSKELVVSGVTGFLYPYGDIAALSDHLRVLVDDFTLRQHLGRAGRDRVLKEYSIERYVAGVEDVLVAAGASI